MSWIDYALSLLEKSWLGTLLGIAGIVFGGLTYLWTRRRTSLGYVHRGEHLLGSASDALPREIVVQYNGISIPRLTKSVLIFWNSGENTVLGSDIVAKDPLRFHVGDDGQILSISVLKAGRPVNDFALIAPRKEMNEAEFTFNFLDANDGVAVEILHTSTDRHPHIKGTLRGLPEGIRSFGQFIRPKPQKNKPGKLRAVGSNLLPIVLLLGGFLTAVYGPRPSFFSNPADLGVVLYSFMGACVGIWLNDRFWTRRRHPKSLNTEALE